MLDRLTITNFKAFATADIPLAPYTLLSGLNSTGKSTVLQALALLRQSHDVLNDDDGGGFLLNGDLVELGTGQDVLHENYVSIGADAEPRVTLSLQCGQDVYTWSVAYEREGDLLRLTESPRPDTRKPPVLFEPGFQYLRADRISPAVTYPRSHEVAIRLGFLGARGEYEMREKLCEFTDLDGVVRFFELHARFTPGAGRLHFRLVPEDRTARVAYIGRKIGS